MAEPPTDDAVQRVVDGFVAQAWAAVAAGEIRSGVDPDELLGAVASLCMSTYNAGPGRAERMVALLVDGPRHGASTIAKART